jgi:methylglutaconyl-CoA hydratase
VAGLVAAGAVAVAAASARFAMSEVRLGVIPAVVAPCVARKVGVSRACELMLTGRRFPAAEAAAIGLVSRVVDDPLLDEAIEEVIADIRQGAPGAQADVKKLLAVIQNGRKSPEDIRRWTGDLLARARSSKEGREGLAAFLDKRQPSWTRDQVDEPQT